MGQVLPLLETIVPAAFIIQVDCAFQHVEKLCPIALALVLVPLFPLQVHLL